MLLQRIHFSELCRGITLVLGVLFAIPGVAQTLVPPPQNFVLRVQNLAAASNADVPVSSSFTMETWISVERLLPATTWVMGRDGHFTIGVDATGKISFSETSAGVVSFLGTPTSLPLHTWSHVAAVLDAGTMRLYVNGTLVGTRSGVQPPAGQDVQFGLGGSYFDDSRGTKTFAGALRQARLWSKALTTEEIQTYATRTLQGVEPGLVADWPLDDGAGTTARDIGPNHYSATLRGALLWARLSIFDVGPYWEYQTVTTDARTVASGGIVNLGPKKKTVVNSYNLNRTTPGTAKAFQLTSNGFADVTSSTLSVDGAIWLGLAVAEDFNGDGRQDLLMTVAGLDEVPFPGGQSHIFMQSADGKLVDETASRLPLQNAYTHSVTVADIDGDGDLDVYMNNLSFGHPGGSEVRPQLYKNDGTGHFTATTAGLPDFVWKQTQLFTSCAFVDVNNDRVPDLVLGGAADSPANVILLNDGHGNFTPAAANALPPKMGGTGWFMLKIQSADFDGDGYIDLIITGSYRYQGPYGLQLLLNNRNGTFRDASSQIPLNGMDIPIQAVSGYWFGAVTPVDFNGDGLIDIVAHSFGNLRPRLFLNQGGANFLDMSEALPPLSIDAFVYPADFDEDGKLDLFSNAAQYFYAHGIKTIALPSSAGCTYTVSSGNRAVAAQGESWSVDITTGPDCPWFVSGLPTWVTATSASSGMGSATIHFQAAANAGGAVSGSFTVAGVPFNIEQQAASIPGLGFIGSMPHIAAQEDWNTTFTLVNKSTASTQARFSMIGDSGSPLPLPVTFPQQGSGSGPLVAASLDRTLAANASLVIQTAGPRTPPVQVGSAQFAAPGDVDGFAVFSFLPTKQEAVVPLETRNASSYLLAFDNANSVVLGVALENVSAQAANVQVVIRDDAGVQTEAGSIALQGNGHTSFVLSDQFPSTKNKRGTIQFVTPAGGRISALGVRFTPPGTLTTIPVLASGVVPGGSMSHIASANGWKTTFVLVNPGANSAQAHLKFYADNGSPLSLPLTFPQSGGGITTASTLDRTLAAGATLIVESTGPDTDPLLTGSAQLTIDGNISGFVIFRYNPNGQEAVVPLENRSASGYLLAFDNTAGIVTGVAVSNAAGQAATVPVVIRDDAGTLIGDGSIGLAANGHTAFGLATQFPVTANIRGTLEFVTPAGGNISALGVRTPPTLTFTTLLALTK